MNAYKSEVNTSEKWSCLSNDSMESQKGLPPLLGSQSADDSSRPFDNLANAQVVIGGENGPDSSPVTQAISPQADCLSTDEQVNPTPFPNQPCPRGRVSLTFSDRLQIAARFWAKERPWGEVTALAAEFGLSRQSIYNISYHYQSLLSTPLVRRQPINESSESFAAQSLTRQEMLNLRMRLILTSVFPGGVTMRPLEDILAEVPFIDSPSDTTIWRLINQACEQADEILSQVDYSQMDLPPVLVAIDETFFNGSPILLVVEPTSLAVCAYYVAPDNDRSSESWNALLELLKKEQNLNFVGALGDAAAAYPKALKELFESKNCFQEDNFHLLYAIERLCSSLEKQAYTAIQKVEDLRKKLQKEGDAEMVQELNKALLEQEQKILLYDQFFEITTWVSDGLEMVDWRSGEIRNREINEWLLDAAIKEMELCKHKKIQKMSRRIKNHKKNLLTYLDWLQTRLAPLQNELHLYLNDTELESFLLQLVARHWRLNHFVESQKKPAWQALTERLYQELESCISCDSFLVHWVAKVQKLLGWAQRTSSAVENVNGILKPMLKRKKRFSKSQNLESFIALFALWHNLRTFKEGKRKGRSPYSILGIDLGEKDWKTLLGYPPVR